MKTVFLRRNEERRIIGGHLWVFSNEIDSSKTQLKDFTPGEQALVRSSHNQLLGTAYINPHSLICARIVNRTDQPLDHQIILERLQAALDLRQQIFKEPFYRLVYGESDLLPGLVIDRFGEHLCIQLNTAGMDTLSEMIIDSCRKLLQPKSILLRNDSSMRELEGLPSKVEAAWGSPPEMVDLIENGVHFSAPLHHGQKTGWFYDQRDNRKMLKPFVQGNRVLDVFSYIGGFAVQAAVFGAREVWSVDASRNALEIAEANARANGVAEKFTGAEGDAFYVLKALRQEGELFDVIIVDPPAFIKKKKDHRQGLKAYRRINELAMRLLRPGGILLAASCSMHLRRTELEDALNGSGCKLERHVQIIGEGGQGADHPVHPAIAETRYLKACLARVM